MLDPRGLTLFDALWAFYQEHEYCGELDTGLDGNRGWMTCACAAASTETLTVTDSCGRSLVRWAVLVRVVAFG